MLLKFRLDKNGFTFTNPADLIAAASIDYIKCHFDIQDETWNNTDAIVAVFKSARYNKRSEMLLDSHNNCFIDPSVYKHGGTIQVKLVGDRYQDEEVISSTSITSVLEFTINENVIIPVETPSKYAVIIGELEKAEEAVQEALSDLAYKLAHGEFDGADGVGISFISYNEDGTLDITMSDGTVYTSAYSMKGDKGETGETGEFISNVAYGHDGTLTITTSWGNTFTSEYSMKGEQGEQGETGLTGDPGVHIGTEPPEDPDKTVWIDPSGGPEMSDIAPLVEEYLDEHPELVTVLRDNSITTVKYQDGSVTKPKLSSDVQSAVNTVASNTSRITAVEGDIDVLDARMDEFTQLPSGSTAGDAELMDIRVGDDGVTYNSAGTAVRTQFSNVKSALTIEASQMENGTTLVYPLGSLTFANTADGRVKCTSEELQEGDVVYLSDTANYQLALSTQNGASLYGWFTGPIVMTATRRYVAIRKSDSSNIQSLPSGEFSRLIHVIRKAEYYQDLIQRSDDEAEQGNYIPYNAGDVPFAITGDNRVKCSTIELNVGDVVHLLDTTNYRIGISQANGGSPYGWFTDPVTITATRKYVIFKDANNADISSMLNLDVSKLIYVTRKSNYQKQIDGIKNSYKFAHVSFDDVRYCMEDITANAGTYTSVFQNPFLAKLKEWHETYGAVFSLYLFSENMGNYTTAFASEFADNADWLKFGFHSVNANSNFENTTAAQAESAYSAFVDNIISIAGTVEAIDRLPRLGNFKGNLESMLAIRDCKCGVVGALSAYDTRDSYYLSSADSAYVKDHGKLYDATNYMTFFRTIMTMEVTNPSTSLPALLTKAEYNNSDYLIGMMHEYEIYTSSYALVSSMADRIEYACDWAVEHEYDWDFPMHRQ